MRILIANDGMGAHYFERMGWYNAFRNSGIEVHMYECKRVPAFDIFDRVEPDIFIGQLYNIDTATIKCLKERPHLKYALRSGEFNRDEKPAEILYTNHAELNLLEDLVSINRPAFIYTHYLQEHIEKTHELFSSLFDLKLVGIPLCADIDTYYQGSYNKSLSCDIGFVGGYWPYKGISIDKYLGPFISDECDLKVKIFGNQPWSNTNKYCGLIKTELVKDLFVSSKICPNINEPHAHSYDGELNERCFKILSSGGFCISDSSAAAKKIFTKGVVFAESPEDFHEKVRFYLGEPDLRAIIAKEGHDLVMQSHTNYHRASLMLKAFDEEQLSKQVLDAYNSRFLKG